MLSLEVIRETQRVANRSRLPPCITGTAATGRLTTYTILMGMVILYQIFLDLTSSSLSGIIELQGLVVQLVRALPCHGRSCGFESRPDRI